MSTENPNKVLNGFGTIIVVELKFTKYTINSGSEAIVGSNNLCRHLKSNTSSANPRRIMQQIHKSAAINSTNY